MNSQPRDMNFGKQSSKAEGVDLPDFTEGLVDTGGGLVKVSTKRLWNGVKWSQPRNL